MRVAPEGQRLDLLEEVPAHSCGLLVLTRTCLSLGLPGLSMDTYLVIGWNLQ